MYSPDTDEEKDDAPCQKPPISDVYSDLQEELDFSHLLDTTHVHVVVRDVPTVHDIVTKTHDVVVRKKPTISLREYTGTGDGELFQVWYKRGIFSKFFGHTDSSTIDIRNSVSSRHISRSTTLFPLRFSHRLKKCFLAGVIFLLTL